MRHFICFNTGCAICLKDTKKSVGRVVSSFDDSHSRME